MAVANDQLLLQITLLTSLILLRIRTSSLVASEEITIAKPGCDPKCGNVSIPFPFGIGKRSCFVDKLFEIVCNSSNASHPKPFLKHTQLEVFNISWYSDAYTSYDQQIVVNGPISFFNCREKESRKTGLNLYQANPSS